MDYKILTADGTEVTAVDMRGNVRGPMTAFAVRGPNFIELNNGEVLYFFGMKFGSQADEAIGCGAMMRSKDGGKTFGETMILAYDGAPVGSGEPLYDPITNTVFLLARTRHWKDGFEEDRLLNENDQIIGHTYERFWLTKSTDNGHTWSDYREIFIEGTPDDFTVQHCTTPGVGLTLLHQKDEKKNGRLVMPCNHAQLVNGQNEFRAHLIYSDDNGETWKMGAVETTLGANESAAVEMNDGTIVYNCRNQGGNPANLRIQGYSTDGGETLLPGSGVVKDLFDPICHAGFAKAELDGKEYILLTAPTGELGEEHLVFGTPQRWGRRMALALYVSEDAGKTYRLARHLSESGKFAAYSAICPLSNGNVLIAWETGPKMGLYRDIVYGIYSAEDLVK